MTMKCDPIINSCVSMDTHPTLDGQAKLENHSFHVVKSAGTLACPLHSCIFWYFIIIMHKHGSINNPLPGNAHMCYLDSGCMQNQSWPCPLSRSFTWVIPMLQQISYHLPHGFKWQSSHAGLIGMFVRLCTTTARTGVCLLGI